MSHWNTLSAPCEARINIRRSRFIAYVAPVSNSEEASEIVAEKSREFGDATHNCFAWVTGFEREHSYYADAGEPSGTAGKPILNALLSAGLTNVVAVVTRYYGGVKLGVRGLIDAYGLSVQEALKEAKLVAAVQMAGLWLSCDYAEFDGVQRQTAKLGGELSKIQYAQDVQADIFLPKEALPQLLEYLDGRSHANRLLYKLKE